MRTTTMLVAFLGVSSTGWAQASLLFDIDQTELRPGESTQVVLSAGFPSDLFAMATVETSILSSVGNDGFSDVFLVFPMDGPGTSSGTPSATGFDDILAGQINFPFPGGTSTDNPIAFWAATYTAPVVVDQPFDVDLATQTSLFDVWVEIGTTEVRVFDDVAEADATIRVVPAPASMALIGLGGVLAWRRRRDIQLGHHSAGLALS